MGTYKQWTEAGAQVKKGEKASYIVGYDGRHPSRLERRAGR